MPTQPAPLGNHMVGAMNSIKEGNQGLHNRVMADGVQAYTMAARYKVTVTRANHGRSRGRRWVWRREACMADY